MATYRNVKVKKPNGGYRTQRAMVLASGKLKFVSNKHKGGASAPRKATVARKSKSKAISKSKRRHHLARMPRRTRRGRGGGGINLVHLGGATLGLAYLMGTQSPVPQVKAAAAKIPGAKSLGVPAMVGVGCLAIDRFVKPNKWLKLLGAAGIVLAASKVGEAGTNFKLEDLDDGVADVGDDDDVIDVGDDEDDDY